jgi:hypothetical protein
VKASRNTYAIAPPTPGYAVIRDLPAARLAILDGQARPGAGAAHGQAASAWRRLPAHRPDARGDPPVRG